ncbi:MAG: hypothetical protein Aurels2KO_32020 [Aureliella sp.]
MSVGQSQSLWNLLAVFTRRKLARAVEREAAVKRGGEFTRVGWESLDETLGNPNSEPAVELLDDLANLTSATELVIIEHMLAGRTQREIAQLLNVDERTVRRRLSSVRQKLASRFSNRPESAGSLSKEAHAIEVLSNEELTGSLPRLEYRDFVLAKYVGGGRFGKVYREIYSVTVSPSQLSFCASRFGCKMPLGRH